MNFIATYILSYKIALKKYYLLAFKAFDFEQFFDRAKHTGFIANIQAITITLGICVPEEVCMVI